MNLPGGGLTTMFLDGKVINKFSDKEGERGFGRDFGDAAEMI